MGGTGLVIRLGEGKGTIGDRECGLLCASLQHLTESRLPHLSCAGTFPSCDHCETPQPDAQMGTKCGYRSPLVLAVSPPRRSVASGRASIIATPVPGGGDGPELFVWVTRVRAK